MESWNEKVWQLSASSRVREGNDWGRKCHLSYHHVYGLETSFIKRSAKEARKCVKNKMKVKGLPSAKCTMQRRISPVRCSLMYCILGILLHRCVSKNIAFLPRAVKKLEGSYAEHLAKMEKNKLVEEWSERIRICLSKCVQNMKQWSYHIYWFSRVWNEKQILLRHESRNS